LGVGANRRRRVRLGSLSSTVGGILLNIALMYQTFDVLSALGFDSVFQELTLSGSDKVFISLYMFLGLSGAALAFIGAYLLWRGYARLSLASCVVGTLSALSTLAIPLAYGFEVATVTMVGTVTSVLLVAVGATVSWAVPLAARPRVTMLSSVEVATVAVFSAIYAAAILMITVPSPTGGYTHIGDLVVFIAALLFGYRVGGLVGVFGAVVADMYTGYSRWFISILAHGLEGLIAGLAEGRALWVQVVMCAVGGFVMASTYFIINIFIKGMPLALISYARDLFAQAGVSIVVGVPIANMVRRVLPWLRQ